MEWIKFEEKVPENDDNICVLIYEDWSRKYNGIYKRFATNIHDENWFVCGGYYDKYEYYIPCNDGVTGGVAGIFNDYNEGQYIRAVAWCPMPEEEEIR